MFYEDVTKTERQEKGVRIWKKNEGKGTLKYIMRFGKTQVAKLITDYLLSKNSSKKIIFAAPTDTTCKNLLDNLDPRVQVYSAKELYNLMKGNPSVLEDVGFLGIDEIHKWFTEQRKDVIRFFSEKQIHKLGLTGSDISEQDCLFLRIHGFPIIDEITEKEALKNKWISPYRNYNLAIELEDHEKKVYAAVSEPIKDVLSSFRGLHKTYKINNVEQFSTEIELVFACLGGKRIGHEYIDAKTMRESVARKRGYKEEYEHEKEPNELIKQIIEYWKPDNIKERCKAYKTCQEARKQNLS